MYLNIDGLKTRLSIIYFVKGKKSARLLRCRENCFNNNSRRVPQESRTVHSMYYSLVMVVGSLPSMLTSNIACAILES